GSHSRRRRGTGADRPGSRPDRIPGTRECGTGALAAVGSTPLQADVHPGRFATTVLLHAIDATTGPRSKRNAAGTGSTRFDPTMGQNAPAPAMEVSPMNSFDARSTLRVGQHQYEI